MANDSTDSSFDGIREVTVDLGEYGNEPGVWITSTRTEQEIFVSNYGLQTLAALLEQVDRLNQDLGRLNLRLVPSIRPGEFSDGGGKLTDGQGQPLDGPLMISQLSKRPGSLSMLAGGVGLRRSVVEGHDSSLSGYGANIDNAPMASAEGATSVVGDIVRDGADTVPGSDSPVEQSAATGAAATVRPHRSTTKNAETA